MKVVRSESELAEVHGGVFVPTMGALHAGHCSLIHAAAAHRRASHRRMPIVVSIFVNPTQFNDPADLAKYPRTLEADLEACRISGADAVFVPGTELIYPPGKRVEPPELPEQATKPKLEDAIRPGHFAGVCQVVKRLFELVQPAAACFGEKDWQQLQVIAAMTRALRLPIEIVPVETEREADGLAMSSRNVFLSPEMRVQARAIPEALKAAVKAGGSRGSLEERVRQAEQAMERRLGEAGLEIQYAVIRDGATLLEPRDGAPARALIAVRLPGVRLIDNGAW